MPTGSKRMWALRGKSWNIDPAPAEFTRKDGRNGPYSTDGVDMRLSRYISIPTKGLLIDPEENHIRELEQSYPIVDLANETRWIWSVLKRPRFWFWLARRPKYWSKFTQVRKGMVLFPGDTALGDTQEEIELFVHPQPEEDGTPNPRLSGRVDGKSSIARLFVIIHVTAGTIHCGTKHRIRLEIKNIGDSVIILTEGMRICQLILDDLSGEAAEDGSTFNPPEGQFVEVRS